MSSGGCQVDQLPSGNELALTCEAPVSINLRFKTQFLPSARPIVAGSQQQAMAEAARPTTVYSSNVLFFGKVPKATARLIAMAAREHDQ
jgi:hypothetical protein